MMTAAKKYDHKPYLRTMLQRLKRNMRYLRAEMGLTVQEAAERAKVHWRHWQTIEAGQSNATLETMVRIANSLKVSLPELLAAELPPVRGKPKIKQAGRAAK
jgi:transcriptional regulator with XRE-family HTH domain